MTGLNIKPLAFFGDGVIIWHVFIEILRYYGTKAVGSLEKFLCKPNVLAGTATYHLSLCEREQLLTSERVIRDAGEGFIGSQKARKVRCQVGLEAKKVGLFTAKSLSSYPPTLLSSLLHPTLPLPIRGGNEKALNSPSDRTSSCNTQVAGAAATLPKRPYSQNMIKPLTLTLSRKGRGKCTSLLTLHPSLKKQAAFTLAEGATHVANFDNVRRAAFTLAEVLITLGIIGVVAALTMPSLIQNARNSDLESALKKNASVIGQALNMYMAENGELITSESGLATGLLKSEIMKYFSVLQDCGMGYGDDSACIKNSEDSNKQSDIYKNFTGNNSIALGYFDDGQFILTDGSLILINNSSNSPDKLYISVDVNGYKKRPNRLGQDLFMFQINKDGKLIPMGAEGTTFYSENDAYCSKTSRDKDNGAGCTYKALSEPAFWKSLP